MNKQELKESLSTVKSLALLKTHSFYSSILVSLKYDFKDEDSITAYTNGCSITLGVKFWNDLTTKERLFLLLHETMHIILMHVQRFKDLSFKNKDSTIYNLAADYFINLTLENDNKGAYEFIEGGCLDQKYSGMSTEEIYKDLLKNPNTQNNNGSGKGGIGSDLSPDNKTGDSVDQKEVDNIVKSAAAMQSKESLKSISSNSGFMSEIALLLEAPKVNWKTVLLKYMNEKFKDSKTYQRPHRRSSYNRKLILKTSKIKQKLGDLLVYIDVSGSCEEEDIINMASELFHIMAMYKPDSILFSTFNTEIQQTFKLTSPKNIPTDLMISGGTEIQCVVDHINTHKNKICVAILMSDFWSGYWDLPDVPLICLSVNNPKFEREGTTVIEYNPN